MPTFADPLTVTTTAGNITFTFINSKQEGKSFVQTWKDLVADKIHAGVLKSKYDESNPSIVRGVVQVTASPLIADGVTRKPATFNISSVAHREHTIADLTTILEACLAAMAVSGVKGKFLARI